MIFICLGTKRFPFNRLLEEIDVLIEQNVIKDNVYAQIGNSTYTPRHYSYSKFLNAEEYASKVNQSNIVITHGGTGAIIKGLKARKQVIAVPRRVAFGEHSDDHQLQIVELFESQGYIWRVDEMDDLKKVLTEVYKKPITKRFKGKGKVLEIIDSFIEETLL